MNTIETIKLDRVPKGKMPVLHASQYDNGRTHGIDLTNLGEEWKLDGTEKLTINERKVDNNICSMDIENTFVGSSHIEFASFLQMCACAGSNFCELRISKGGVDIGTLNFILEVEPDPTADGIESESEIRNLKTQIEAITEEVIGDDYYTAEETDEAIATAIEGKADTTYVDTELDKKADKSNTYTKTEVDEKIDALPEPMIFKGTLGVGGTIQTLPTASASNEGYTYKVITDGTYAGQTAKSGDVFTSNGSEWVYIPSGDEDNDTWRAIKVEGVEKLDNGISSGAVDFVGSDNIEVEFDANGNKVGIKTKNIYTEDQVDSIVSDAIYNVLPDDTASGAVANFNTSLELPIKSLEIDVNAVQSAGTPTPATPLPISGWSEIKAYQRGINLWNENTEIGSLDNTTGQPTSDNNRLRSADYCSIKENETVYVKKGGLGNINLFFYDASKTFLSKTGWISGNATRNIPSGAYYFKIVLATQYGTTYNNDISINYPSSDTAYHAYNPNGNTEVINLGGTYYGGHFTQDKAGHRQFEVTSKFATFTGANNESWNDYPAGNGFFINLINDHITESYGDGKCNILPTSKAFPNLGIVFGINSSYIFLMQVKSSWNISTVNELRDFLSVNNLQVVYTLAEPIIIDLPDGEPINTFAGVNNFFADTGDTEVVFKCSVNDYVSAHSGGNLLGMGGVYLGGAKSGGSEEETDEGEDTEKTKLDEPKEEIKTIGDTKKLGGE